MSATCPTCGDGFDDKGGMRYHHARVHGESIAGDEIECANCGKVENRNPAKIRDGDNYCSPECHNEDQRINVSKDRLYELYWGDMKTIGEVANEVGLGETTTKRKMRRKGIPVRSTGRNPKSWLFIMRPDEWKRSEYVDQKKSTYTIAKENHVSQEWVRKMFVEMGIPLRNSWIVNKLSESEIERLEYDYGPDWDDIREGVVSSYNYQCQGCGRYESDLGHSLQVHHIQRLRTFKETSEANKNSNLVPYCYPCHNRWEGIPVQPSLTE